MTSAPLRVIEAVFIALVLFVSGCGGPRTQPNADEAALRLVALGDSISTDEMCVGCSTFVRLYGQLLARRTGSAVKIDNLSVPGSNVMGLIEQTATDTKTRAALAHADIVTVTIGINDTPWNRADDPCQAAAQYPFIRWRDITAKCTAKVTHEYSASLDRVLRSITSLHRGKRSELLRLTTVYNAVLGNGVNPTWNSPTAEAPTMRANAAFAKAQCTLAARYGGRCADMLHAMNGPLTRGDAARFLASDHTHLNQRGHQLTARVLERLGA